LAVAKLSPINVRMNQLLADQGYVEQVLTEGAARASAIAAPIMKDVKKIVGFV
jgi:tryptophanyl-tRNA synthetase